MRIPLSSRGESTRRTVQGIIDDHERFVNAGGDIRKAKEYNNCIAKPFFDIPISQVLLIHNKSNTLLYTIDINIRCACQDYTSLKGCFKRYLHSLKRLVTGLTLCWHHTTNLNS